MQILRMISIALPGFLTLAACGGGSSPVIGPNSDNFAPNIPLNVVQSENAVTRRVPAGGGDISVETVPIDITFNSDGTILVRFEGGNETILTNAGGMSYEGLTPGTNEEMFLTASGLLPTGTNVSAVNISVVDAGALDQSTVLVGNPSNSLPSTNGVTFNGDAHVRLVRDGIVGSYNLVGTVSINADFADNIVGGALSYDYDGAKTVGLVIPAELVGNSFSSTQVVDGQPDFSVSNATFEGTFYGEGAPEVAGTIIFDYVDDAVGETGTVGATYIAAQ